MQYGDHDPEDANQAPLKMTGTHAVNNPLAMNQYKALEERLKDVEGFDAIEVDALEIGLVPDVVIPPKFKVPYKNGESNIQFTPNLNLESNILVNKVDERCLTPSFRLIDSET